MFNKIAQDEKLKNKIKLIGIGAGNSPFEVDFFQKTYNVPEKFYTILTTIVNDRFQQATGLKIHLIKDWKHLTKIDQNDTSLWRP